MARLLAGEIRPPTSCMANVRGRRKCHYRPLLGSGAGDYRVGPHYWIVCR